MSQFEDDRDDYMWMRIGEALVAYGRACHDEQERRKREAAEKRARRMQRWYWRAWYAIKEKP
jgi:hypothetical protein